MGAIFIMIVSSVASAVGWWLGDYLGFAGAVALSTVGGFVGLYYGMKWNRELFCE